MRKLLFLIGLAIAITPASALAQASGVLGGPAPDIRNSDMSMHDYTPDLHDQVVKYRERERSDQIRAQNSVGASRAARKEELTAGATVNDKTGVAIAKIEQIDADGIVVSTGLAKVKVPADAFGHNKAGLLLDMTKAQFAQVVASANAAH